MSFLRRLIERVLVPARASRREAVASHRQRNPVAWSSMAALLEDLETLGDEYEELYDTDVRERLWEIFDRQLLRQQTGEPVPREMGMFSVEANERLRAIVEEHLAALKEVFEIFELDSETKRRVSFFNPKLRTERGSTVEDFFGSP